MSQPIYQQQQPLRHQSTRSMRSATIVTKTKSSNTTTIQLKNGKQLPLLPWMKVHHLPQYGIGSSISSSVAQNNSTGDTELSSTQQSSVRSRNNNKRSIESISSAASSTIANGSTTIKTYTTPQVSASNYKTKKDIAVNSLYPPTTQEIYGHVRYLSEEGMKLVMKEVDDCVGYTLKYSSTAKLNNGKGSSSSKMKCTNNDLIPLATEIHNYFDIFQPDDEYDEQDNTTISMKTVDESSLMMTNTPTAESIKRQDILRDMLPNKYDPTLLPMAIIKCYPNVLDRVEITKGLVSDLSKKQKKNDEKQKKSPCVCIIKSSSELVQQGHLLTEILSQCISKDPDGEAFALELQKQRKRHKSTHHGGVNRGVLFKSIWSWSQSLVEWAGFTEVFDSIIIVLEVSCCISHMT